MPTTTSLAISGLASGFDWQSLVSQLVEVERAPETTLQTEQTKIQQRNNAYGSILTELSVFNNRVTALKDPTLFDSRLSTSSDSTIASATAKSGSALGSYTFNITQIASNASQRGADNAGKALSATDDVSGLVLSNAGYVSAITAGNFTVNGKTVAVATTDTLQDVFDKISTATGNTVTASYNSAQDKISFSSASPIILGSATDTSNFLQASKLFNNGTGTIQSASSLGGVKLSGPLSSANLGTAIDDGGSGAGVFKINGVEINFNASTDSVTDVLKRINDSTAGVSASYDSVNDRFQITNKTAGDVGIALEDVTGNFLAATNLSSGTLQRGKNLLYNIDGGGSLTSQTNTITEDTSGLIGLSVNALKVGSVTVSVNSDSAKIKSAITDFVTEYNRVQSLIDTQTASTTDAKGKVTAGILAGEGDANAISSSLRRLANTHGLSGVLKTLDDLGIVSNGNDNTLSVANSAKLDSALANNLSSVQDLFTNPTSGLAVTLSSYLNSTIGDDGTLPKHQAALTKQSTDIDKNISSMERIVLQNQQRLTDSFVAMEVAQSKINQQLQYLTKFTS